MEERQREELRQSKFSITGGEKQARKIIEKSKEMGIR